MGNANHSNQEQEQRRLILVVDDDEVIVTTIASLLEEEGYAVLLANNGKEALQQLEQNQPDLILLDMKMPVMDGWEFASVYQQRPEPHAPIIVMTAAHDSRSRAAEIAAQDYLAKPFDVDHLLDLIQRFVGADDRPRSEDV